MKLPDTLRFTGSDPSIKGIEKQKLMQQILDRLEYQAERNKATKQEFQAKVPGILVGSSNYPNVRTGFLSTEQYESNDNPKEWSQDESRYSIPEIIRLRSMLVNSNFVADVKLKSSFSDKIKEASLSIRPIEAEVRLQKRPYYALSLSPENMPYGPSVELNNLRITENAKIPRQVDRVESDTDLKAGEAVATLTKEGFDEHYVTRIFSSGSLGVKAQRKLVPTRWAITAVDDTIGRQDISELRDYEQHELSLMFSGYLGNYYLAIMLPGPWSYELFETYVGPGLENPKEYESASDYEGWYGRKAYASSTAGGYYAARLAALEYLKGQKKTAQILLLRFITDEYWAPLGVWVVREASRKSFGSQKIAFSSEKAMLKQAEEFAYKRFKIDISRIYAASKLLEQRRNQSTLADF